MLYNTLRRIPYEFRKTHLGTSVHNIFFILNELTIDGACDSSCLIAACKSTNIIMETITELLNMKIMPNHETVIFVAFNMKKTIGKQIIDKFIDYGYNLTLDDYAILTNHNISIDISRVNCPINDIFDRIANEEQTASYIEDMLLTHKEIKPKISILHIACASGNLKLVKLLIEKYKLIPDEICLEKACTDKSNYNMLKYLIGYNLNPNVNCLLNMLSAVNTKTSNYLVDIFNEKQKSNNTK
jgi:hypothetical protein